MKKFLSLLVFVAALMTSLAAKADPITIYVKKSAPFTYSHIYAWYNDNTKFTSDWPGNAINKNVVTNINGEDYYSYVFTNITTSSFSIIFNNGQKNNTTQTVDITGVTADIAISTAFQITGSSNKYSYSKVSIKMATPVISCTENVVSITCKDNVAKIHYTTDGNEPTAESPVWENDLRLTEGETLNLQAKAIREGFPDSDVAIKEVVFETLTAETPVISQSANKVTISCGTANAKIYYTTDGTEPTVDSNLYEGSFELSENCTVKAIATKENFQNSEVATFYFAKFDGITVYVEKTKGSPFTIGAIWAWYKNNGNNTNIFTESWPGSKAFLNNTTTVNGKEYYYWKFDAERTSVYLLFNDGKSNTSVQTIDSKEITSDIAIKILTTKTGSKYNLEYKNVKLATPSISCTDNTVSISCTDTKAAIYYTTDGTEPNICSNLYSESFDATGISTVKAIAVLGGFITSNVAEMQTVEKPVISQNGNFVTITTATEGATIYYTLTSAEAGENTELSFDELAFEYVSPFEISDNSTVVAVAKKEGCFDSEETVMECVFVDGIRIYVQTSEIPFVATKVFAKDSKGNVITSEWPGNDFQGSKDDKLQGESSNITLAAYVFDTANAPITFSLSDGTENYQTVDIKASASSSYQILNQTDENGKYLVQEIKTTGVESIINDSVYVNMAPEYYNLQGVKVINPGKGLFIKKVGNAVEKVFMR